MQTMGLKLLSKQGVRHTPEQLKQIPLQIWKPKLPGANEQILTLQTNQPTR